MIDPDYAIPGVAHCALTGCTTIWSASLEPDRQFCQAHQDPNARRLARFETWNCKRCERLYRVRVSPLVRGQTHPSHYCDSCRRARPKPTTKTLGAADLIRCPLCDRTCHRAGILHHLGKNHPDLADLRLLRGRYPALYKAIVKAQVPPLREIDRHRVKGLTSAEISLCQNNGEQISRANVEKLLGAGKKPPQSKPSPEPGIPGAEPTPAKIWKRRGEIEPQAATRN
jgi:hypothetical protein